MSFVSAEIISAVVSKYAQLHGELAATFFTTVSEAVVDARYDSSSPSYSGLTKLFTVPIGEPAASGVTSHTATAVNSGSVTGVLVHGVTDNLEGDGSPTKFRIAISGVVSESAFDDKYRPGVYSDSQVVAGEQVTVDAFSAVVASGRPESVQISIGDWTSTFVVTTIADLIRASSSGSLVLSFDSGQVQLPLNTSGIMTDITVDDLYVHRGSSKGTYLFEAVTVDALPVHEVRRVTFEFYSGGVSYSMTLDKDELAGFYSGGLDMLPFEVIPANAKVCVPVIGITTSSVGMLPASFSLWLGTKIDAGAV